MDADEIFRAMSRIAHESMTPEQRAARAKKAGNTRWAGKPTVPCPKCGAATASLRAAAAHCRKEKAK